MKILQVAWLSKILVALSLIVPCGLVYAKDIDAPEPKIEKCFITIKTNQKDLMVDATTLKSLSFNKVDKASTGWRAFLNFGTYPTISITSIEAGSKVLFFEENEEAKKVYDKAVTDFKKCKSLLVL